MAELHLVGQILGGSGFQLDNLFCKWSIETGVNFRLLQGSTDGQTHCDYPNVRGSRFRRVGGPMMAPGACMRAPSSRCLGRPTNPPCGPIRLTCTGR